MIIILLSEPCLLAFDRVSSHILYSYFEIQLMFPLVLHMFLDEVMKCVSCFRLLQRQMLLLIRLATLIGYTMQQLWLSSIKVWLLSQLFFRFALLLFIVFPPRYPLLFLFNGFFPLFVLVIASLCFLYCLFCACMLLFALFCAFFVFLCVRLPISSYLESPLFL